MGNIEFIDADVQEYYIYYTQRLLDMDNIGGDLGVVGFWRARRSALAASDRKILLPSGCSPKLQSWNRHRATHLLW